MISPIDRRLAEARSLRKKAILARLIGLGLGVLAFFAIVGLFSAGNSTAAVVAALVLGGPAVGAFAYGNSQGRQANLQQRRAEDLADRAEFEEAGEEGRARTRRREQ